MNFSKHDVCTDVCQNKRYGEQCTDKCDWLAWVEERTKRQILEDRDADEKYALDRRARVLALAREME